MKKKILLIILFYCSINSLYSQWFYSKHWSGIDTSNQTGYYQNRITFEDTSKLNLISSCIFTEHRLRTNIDTFYLNSTNYNINTNYNLIYKPTFKTKIIYTISSFIIKKDIVYEDLGIIKF